MEGCEVLFVSIPSEIVVGFRVEPMFEVRTPEGRIVDRIEDRRKLVSICWYRGEERLSEDGFYVPTTNDVGNSVHVVVTPEGGKEKRSGSARVRKEPPYAQPRPFIISKKAILQPPHVQTVRILSYNILSPALASKDHFPYTKTFAVDFSFRRGLILREMSVFESDIICLQEIPQSQYRDFFEPYLSVMGYQGLFKLKSKQTMAVATENLDGCAVFFKRSRFILRKYIEIDFDRIARTDGSVAVDKETLIRFAKSNVAQIAILEMISQPQEATASHSGIPRTMGFSKCRFLCLSNTHLTSDQRLEDVKLFQTCSLIREVTDAAYSFVTESGYGLEDMAFALCGDFNSLPSSASYKYVTERSVPPELLMKIDETGALQDLQENHALEHGLPLFSAYKDTIGREPVYTNYVKNFQGCLDYVFVGQVTVVGVLGEPVEEDIRVETALPSSQYPSDHIPLLAEMVI